MIEIRRHIFLEAQRLTRRDMEPWFPYICFICKGFCCELGPNSTPYISYFSDGGMVIAYLYTILINDSEFMLAASLLSSPLKIKR